MAVGVLAIQCEYHDPFQHNCQLVARLFVGWITSTFDSQAVTRHDVCETSVFGTSKLKINKTSKRLHFDVLFILSLEVFGIFLRTFQFPGVFECHAHKKQRPPVGMSML